MCGSKPDFRPMMKNTKQWDALKLALYVQRRDLEGNSLTSD